MSRRNHRIGGLLGAVILAAAAKGVNSLFAVPARRRIVPGKVVGSTARISRGYAVLADLA
jgi:hypothetical protein